MFGFFLFVCIEHYRSLQDIVDGEDPLSLTAASNEWSMHLQQLHNF
jgi:hypothetical protein